MGEGRKVQVSSINTNVNNKRADEEGRTVEMGEGKSGKVPLVKGKTYSANSALIFMRYE